MDNNPRKRRSEKGRKVFDPRDASTGSDGAELLDPSVTQRSEQWWMYLAGQPRGFGATDIYSAYLPKGAPLSAAGWNLTRGVTGGTCASRRAEIQPGMGR
jgi:hypothetical protein